MAENID